MWKGRVLIEPVIGGSTIVFENTASVRVNEGMVHFRVDEGEKIIDYGFSIMNILKYSVEWKNDGLDSNIPNLGPYGY